MKPLIILIIGLFIVIMTSNSCKKDLLNRPNAIEMMPKLTDYHIFQGIPSALVPSADYKLYELSTSLFTDYAEKQRLLKLPAGGKMVKVGDGLPDFPEGTIMVKTFYYYDDVRNPLKGKRIIETRLLIKESGIWNIGTYKWNDEQTEAYLSESATDTNVEWIDGNGNAKHIGYHIPGINECVTCHNSANTTIPIGPKLRNLNINVSRNGSTINQLSFFQKLGFIDTVDPSSIPALPNWHNLDNTLEQRARAYLDVNCAHCHSDNGFASNIKLRLDYNTSLEESRIIPKSEGVINKMTSGAMPKLGTTVIHEEGLELIIKFIESKK